MSLSSVPPASFPGPAAAAGRGLPIPGSPVAVEVATGSTGEPAPAAVVLAPPPLTCAEPIDAQDRSIASAVYELAKPRITRLVVLTALGGLALAAVGSTISWLHLAVAAVACALGTSLSSGGANALNQVMESARDARMDRTRRRPIPSGRLTRTGAAIAGALMLAAGAAVLWLFCGPAAATVALATAAIYLALYTPLKPLTVLNTWVGAIPGALPPLIGWAAAAHVAGDSGWASLTQMGGWSLFILMAVWQIPHFLALAWFFRDDYARGGYRMLPINDPTGRATVTQIVLWSALLIPASLAPWLAMPERVGIAYAIVAAITGIAYFYQSARLIADRSPKRARRVFFASVIHLPVLIVALAASVAFAH